MPGLRLAILSLVLLTACGQALAQFGGMRRGGGDSGTRNRSDSSGELSGVTRISANDQIRLQMTDFRLALKLAPEQNPLFDAYQSKVFDLLSDLSRGGSTPSEEPAPKQIDRKVDTVRNRLAAMEELSDAAKKLYAALNDEQRKIADRMLAGTVPTLYSGLPDAAQRGGSRGSR